MRISILFFFSMSLTLVPVHATETRSDCVIVLHGLGRTAWSMSKVERTLTEAGYNVWNKTYPSRAKNIQNLANEHISQGLNACRDQSARQIHFVSHSMGGILVRQYLQNMEIGELGKIVMLSPPNQGSELSDFLREYRLFDFIMGPAGQQLGTGSTSLPKSLAPVPGKIGVITGNKGLPLLSKLIPGDDDGKVSVESAKLREMTDFLVVGTGHTFIMNNEEVLKEILTFLETGRFANGLVNRRGRLSDDGDQTI